MVIQEDSARKERHRLEFFDVAGKLPSRDVGVYNS
ncbi:MAG: hypothetical protein KatS3mg087_0266 [Patescibacteria group bacterium]|nr:MAG: hypothetical protein KatS3mg087_0266 [Patescibacteria group bacterium]